ncbi:longitudinals lacking protein, isoforms H/M/V isoform X2 [Aethina tumida]|uniref:longitudinals lacking protein, isoforms H/M/V isoform X2 n=1 Tax=Aethina tumida TaxID=116153 RepID=UPI002148AAC7|nr:longitudinals lacking protein, isoforms H/M/V isoform X2 [Aethina tumida]
MTMQQYCLRWNNHQPNFISVFSNLLNSESLVDVTLAAEGKHLQAHKVVLSACSSYFQTLFTINPCQHPIVILKDVKFKDLKVMVEFMYYGEVNVSQDQLTHILKTAEMLKIKGLAEMPVDQTVKQPSNNTSTDRAELLTPSDLNWSSDAHRQSLSPSPCPLSPSARRKRLRKTSTGSNSGSGDRTSDEHPSEIMIPTPTGNIVGTIIKPESGSSDRSSTPQKLRQHSSDSELLRGSSHESTEGETHHQITLQVPQQTVTTQNVEASNLDVAGPSTSVSQQSVPGIQWNVVDPTGYPQHYAACSQNPPQTGAQQPVAQYVTVSSNVTGTITSCAPAPPACYPNQIANSPPQIMQKRKRSINPQADENFIRALEAVRFGGIGFCKAARMFGVNNRTLWLEYKKRGYPNFRLSIKNRKAEGGAVADVDEHAEVDKQEAQGQMMCVTASHPVALIANQYYESKPPQKYLDAALINAQQTINFQGLNFEQV